jgi:hypothetical protein
VFLQTTKPMSEATDSEIDVRIDAYKSPANVSSEPNIL